MCKKNHKKYPIHIARGYEDDIYVEYQIFCHKCGSDWLILNGKYKGEQLLKCKKCNCRFPYYKCREENARKFLYMYLMYFKGYSAKRTASELGIHTSTATGFEKHIEPHLKFFVENILAELFDIQKYYELIKKYQQKSL